MSQSGLESKSAASERLEIVGYDDKNKFFTVKSPTGNTLQILDTYAEMFTMWAGRVLITADSERWALTAARTATGLATSVIMSPAEAGIEGVVPANATPDGRTGVLIQIYNRNRFELKSQMILRIGQCIMTCPTASAFDAMLDAKRRLKVGRSIRLFGDGFQKKVLVGARKAWKIPVMEGAFIVEDSFGASEAIAGGNFLILAREKSSGLKAAEEAVESIRAKAREVIMPFPDGICRSGSKAGSLKYKLKASTNHPFCPTLKALVPDTQVPENVNCVYEIVINGLSVDAVKRAMTAGLQAAASVPGVVRISAGNYGGKIGPFKAFLKDTLSSA
ncbi:MAG: formylmethanofuran--tetrahydromethanopterin N-formyltransferase [Candidatus Bathyarchaeia archaeon]|jgi:formylmethanofuran--tetrahydromethanopterin N-formyltransferase